MEGVAAARVIQDNLQKREELGLVKTKGQRMQINGLLAVTRMTHQASKPPIHPNYPPAYLMKARKRSSVTAPLFSGSDRWKNLRTASRTASLMLSC